MDAPPEGFAVERVDSGPVRVESARDDSAQADSVAAERLLEASARAGWAEVQDDSVAPAAVAPDDYSTDSLRDDCSALLARVAATGQALDSVGPLAGDSPVGSPTAGYSAALPDDLQAAAGLAALADLPEADCSAAPLLGGSQVEQLVDGSQVEQLPGDSADSAEDFPADSSADWRAVPVARRSAALQDVQSSALPVCPEALPSPSAAPPANWPDAASALRS